MTQLQEQRELCDKNRKKFEEEFDKGIIFGVFQEVKITRDADSTCGNTEILLNIDGSEKQRSASPHVWRELCLNALNFPTDLCPFLYRVGRLWNALKPEEQEWAKELGYSESLWDSPDAALRIPSAILQLELENYLEPSQEFLFTQIVGCVIMVIVVFSEVRHFVVAFMVARFLHADWKHKVVITILAGFSYIVVPVFTLMGSMLVIMESGKELDVMKDAIALLFLIEVNNFLQIATTEHSPRWKFMLPKKCVTQLDRAKNHFLLMASVLILIFAAGLLS